MKKSRSVSDGSDGEENSGAGPVSSDTSFRE